MKSSSRNMTEVLYSASLDAERMEHTDAEACVFEAIEGYEVLPDTIRVFAWKRREADLDAESVLEFALELLDEEYGDPDAGTDPTPGMKAAAAAFRKAMLEEFVSWSCVRAPELDRDVKVAGNPYFEARP